MKIETAMLTTVDNPYNPFEDFPRWLEFDHRKGYNTSEFLGRICFTTNNLTELDYHQAIEKAVDEAVEENLNGLYLKVTKEIEIEN